ncbi:MAG: EAL domain-containing protein [Hamadaea sp.]|nr:EAL domain-containing protein [Hamadaea sp.]
MVRRRTRLLYAIAMAVLVVAYFAVPRLRPYTELAIGIGSVWAILAGTRRHIESRRTAWTLIAAGIALQAISTFVYGIRHAAEDGVLAYPDVPGLGAAASLALLSLGLLLLGRPHAPAQDWTLALDIIAVGLAVSLLVWITLTRPAVVDLHLTGFAKDVAIAATVGYAAVFAGAALIAVAWRANPAVRVLGVGLVGYLLWDYFRGEQVLAGTWSAGGLTDLGLLAFLVLTGGAALMPSAGEVAAVPHRHGGHRIVRLLMVAAALLVVPTLLLSAATGGPLSQTFAIGVCAALIGIVMIIRTALTARAYHEKALRERTLREAARAFMLATTRHEVTGALNAAMRGLAPEKGGVLVLDPGEDTAGAFTVPLTVAQPGGAAPVQVGTAVFLGPPGRLETLRPTLDALAEQAASALYRIAVVRQLAAEERERYFRTLVLTSRDVTLISKAGRIVYATPSAARLFGGDVLGRDFGDLVRRDGGDGWPDVLDGAEGEITRPEGTVAVLVHRRDLSADPTVGGVVTTLRDITAERDLRRDLAHRASHDALTGLANPQLFRETVDVAVQTPGTAVLVVDIDDFKMVNDNYGHPAGDRLLIQAARRIASCIGPGDVAARIGGDEFAVLLSDAADIATARGTAQQVADLLARPMDIGDAVVVCRSSVGLAHAAAPARADTLLHQADIALYAAKSSGKGRWRQYAPHMETPSRKHIAAAARLEAAMASGALTLHYQPIVDLVTGKPVGMEALLRLHDDGEPMSPPQMVSAAEGNGLIGAFGEWVLARALTDRLRFPPVGSDCYVSVNVTARQLRQPDFVTRVRRQLDRTGVEPQRLVLEVSENLPIEQDDPRPWDHLDKLAAQGVCIAIDDYGTGYASLGYLQQPSVSIVKMDRIFLRSLTPRAQRLIHGVTATCLRIGITQIAEGVETEQARQLLIEAGCPYGQGYLFARPMPIDDAIEWLRAHL